MNQGMAMFLILVFAWGVFGLCCSFTCAKFTIIRYKSKWQKTAAIVVFINIGLTVLGFLANMISG